MKKNIPIIFVLVFLMAACSNPSTSNKLQQSNNLTQSEPLQPIEASPVVLPYEDFLGNLDSKEKNWTGLTTEQYIEDFDYLYEQLKENYPFFGVAKRKNGVDLDEQYIQAHRKVELCDNDYDFRLILNEDFLTYIGHLESWGSIRYFNNLNNTLESSKQSPDLERQLAPYLKALENPVSKSNYGKMKEFFDKQEQDYDTYLKNMGENTEVPQIQSEDIDEPTPNVKTEIIEEGKIAYVSILSFDMNSYGDKKTLFDFYEEVADYENLIFDISENSGGDMSYFIDLMAAPNIDSILSTPPLYGFIKGGENNLRFLPIDEGIKSGAWKLISEAPNLPKMNENDLQDFDYFESSAFTIEPLNSEKIFKGKMWLLVSNNVYSSSEFAAMFSKSTGFATLVGTNTGGDGIGTNPLYIVLPNSGIVIKYSAIYGTTADGANSEEFGTKPDIESRANENPLDTCLRIIRKNE